MSFKWKIFDIMFVMVSVINIVISLFFGTTSITYILLAIIVIALISGKIDKDTFLLYSLFIPNKYLQLIAIPIYLMKSGAIKKRDLRNSEVAFLCYIAIFGIINCVVYNGFFIGTLFQIGVYYCILKMLATYERSSNFAFSISVLDKMFVLQVVTCFIDYLYYRKIDDFIMGTLISAHYLGVFLLVYMYLLIKIKPPQIKTIGYITRFVIVLFLLLISDAKHVWALFIGAWIISFLLRKLKIKNKITAFVIAMTAFVVIGTLWITSSQGAPSLQKYSLASTYIFNENFNKKITFFARTFNEMISLNGLFGFGVGQFGSQISLTLSKGIIYSWNPALSAYKYAIQPYASAISGIMTEWYTTYGIGISSMVLGYPLVSFIGLFAELGVIGYIWLLRIFDKRFRNDDIVFILAFFLLTLFDTYFEIPCVFVLILLATFANNEGTRIQLRGRRRKKTGAR